MLRPKMTGERVWATRVFGGTNSRHQFGYNTGGTSFGFGTLGPRRERHNRVAKALANTQRRRLDREAVEAGVAAVAQDAAEAAAEVLAVQDAVEAAAEAAAW